MKRIQPLQEVISLSMIDDLGSPQGTLITWADTLKSTTNKGIYEAEIMGMHSTTKTHIHCINPAQLRDVENGRDCAVSPSGISSLCYLDGQSVRTVTSLVENSGMEIIGVCDASGLRDNIWLNNIVVDKFIMLSTIEKMSTEAATAQDMTMRINAQLAIARMFNVGPKWRTRKRFYIISSCDASTVKLIATVLYACFPESMVLGLPVTKAVASTLTESKRDVRLSDSAAVARGSCRKDDSLVFCGKVSAIINLYKRYDTCIEIYDSLINQSYPPSYIYVWINGSIKPLQLTALRERMPVARFVVSDENLGVWARFAFGLNMVTEYTVVFDDDTVPGSSWIENCMHCMAEREGLYGTVGLIYNQPLAYMNHTRVGWPAPNEDTTVVDIVGHSWFFKTAWLRHYWYHTDNIDGIPFCGEDMHFSYALQQIGIKTMVPPHPVNNKSLWGSLKGIEAGTGQEAISISGKGSMMDVPLKHLVARGFSLLGFTSENNRGLS